MENAIDYEDALQRLIHEETISPIYAIVSGVKPLEGAIVVDDRWGSSDVIRMKDFDDGLVYYLSQIPMIYIYRPT